MLGIPSLTIFGVEQGADDAAANEQMGQQPRFSLLDGAYHANGRSDAAESGIEDESLQSDHGNALARRADQALQLAGVTFLLY